MHTHLVPRTVLEAAERGAHDLTLSSGHLVIEDRDRLPLQRLGHPPALLDWIDQQQLDGAIASVPPPLFRYHLTGSAAASWAQLINDGMAALAGLDGGRLRVLGHLPLSAPSLAPGIARDVLADGGFSGFALGTLGTEPGIANPALDDLWEILDAAGSFVLLHPSATPDPRLHPYYLSNLLGNPYETALAAAGLVFSNLLARFPRIRFCLCHGGGVTAAVAGRWQRGADTTRPGISPLSLTPREALRHLYVDDLVHDPAMLQLVESTFGSDHVLTGSDWPFPMGCDTLNPTRATARATLTESLTRPPTAPPQPTR